MKITMELSEQETVLLSHALQWSIDYYCKRARKVKTPLVREQCRMMADSLALIRIKFLTSAPEVAE